MIIWVLLIFYVIIDLSMLDLLNKSVKRPIKFW